MIFEPTEDYETLLPEGMKHIKLSKPETTPTTNQFVRIAFNLIKDQEWREKHRCSLSCYLYIAHKAVRGPGSHDKYDLYHRYYLDNKIAAAPSVREMAKAFGYKQTGKIRKWVKELEIEGAFIIEKINVGQPEPANVYVIGEFQAKEEIWYYGNIRGF